MSMKYKTGYKRIDEKFVKQCDEDFDNKLNDTVGEICRDSNTKIIGITGPTCSGKTTTARKVIDYYSSHNIKLHVISLDDFFKDQFSREDKIDPKTVDFDSPDTFDTEEFYSFITNIFTKGEADKPIFDFVTGDRDKRERITMGENDVFLLEGIQLLYPQVETLLHEMNGKSIYLCVESGIKVGDMYVPNEKIRLMRRLVRDSNFRASDPYFTLDLWRGVRRNENLNILPHARRCDVNIDTTQAYELNILKPYLEKILGGTDSTSEHYAVCMEILAAVANVDSISRDALSASSLYNEFV